LRTNVADVLQSVDNGPVSTAYNAIDSLPCGRPREIPEPDP